MELQQIDEISNQNRSTTVPIVNALPEVTATAIEEENACADGNAALSNGTWNEDHTSWQPNDCIYKPPSAAAVQSCLLRDDKRRIAFIGDSVMHRVYRKSLEFFKVEDHSCKTVKHIGRYPPGIIDGQPQLHRYYNLTLPEGFIPPPPKDPCENPFRLDEHGEEFDWFGQTGCSGCGPEVNVCSSFILDSNAVEFASDVELLTPEYNTSQETVVRSHLYETQPDIVIVSAGHHDAFLWGHPDRSHCRPGTVERYAQNLEIYAQLLSEYRDAVIKRVHIAWFTLSLVATEWQPDLWKNKTDNGMIREMNAVAIDIMNKFGISVIDVWSLSSDRYTIEHLNDGGVHIDGENGLYYEILSQAIFYDVCQ